LALFTTAVGGPASIALATMECPRAIVAITAVGAALTVVLVWLLMTRWGLLGAAYALFVSGLAGAVGRWAAFHWLVTDVRDLAPCARQNEREFDHTMPFS
jgi:O-antigen/teichoic acid export membrane protein